MKLRLQPDAQSKTAIACSNKLISFRLPLLVLHLLPIQCRYRGYCCTWSHSM